MARWCLERKLKEIRPFLTDDKYGFDCVGKSKSTKPTEYNDDCIKENPGIVIDNGSYTIRAGFAGYNEPQCTFSSMVIGPDHKGWYHVGYEADARKRYYPATYPIQNGIITDWSYIQNIWYGIFHQELRMNGPLYPEKYPVLLTESPFNHKYDREIMMEIMFERFEVPAVFVIMERF